MPRLSCWMIKASLAHLAVGVLLGGLMLSAEGLPASLGWAWLFLPAHIQLVVGGWLIQLALGMAYWILPRLSAAGERGRPGAAWFSFGALNGGVSGAALILVIRPFMSAPWLNVALIVAALCQLGALVAFAWHAWPRVQPIALPETLKRA